jgi:hypothetical protein
MSPTPADPHPAERRLTRLEDELTTLTGHINAATARFLSVLAEFDRLEGHKPHGLVSTAHWLHWRCGFGLNAAREKVRVARALVELPQIRACFETGALSYSKVRAMTRIATPANEHVLLQVARHGTTRHVETLVSKWRGAERSREVQRAGRQHAVRELRWHYDDDGCLMIRVTLPPEQGALVIEALQAAMDRLEEGEEGCEPCSADTAPVDPACMAAVRRDDVSAETSDALSASSVTPSQLRADALVYLSESWLAGHGSSDGTGDAYLVNVHIDSATLAHAVAGRSELAEGPGLAAATVRRLCCDGGLVTHVTDAAGATIDVGRKTRAIPPAIRRALRHRDRCCRFPGCTRSRWLDGHHLIHWADGGETSLDNLVLLCRHHHRLVHEGGFGAHVDAGGDIRFTTPARAVISQAPKGHALALPLEQVLETFQLKRGLVIGARTADCHWRGEPMDYDTVGWLLGQAAMPDESGECQPSG